LAVERSVARLLQWSNWRRWHQAWARWHHYRKRAGGAPAQGMEQVACEVEDEQVVDAQEAWRRLELWLASLRRSGRPYSQPRREVFDAIVEVMQTDCGWQALPSQFPRWKTVYAQYSQWRKAGIWDRIWTKSSQRFSVDELQL
jgi:Putative transposase of IS4/5 family (DUF4096)